MAFQPTAIKQLFGLDANELTNKWVDLNLILRNNLADQVLCQTSVSHQVDVLSNFIKQQVKLNHKNEASRIDLALESTKREPSGTSLSTIQARLALSERSLQRLFKTTIGISPKLFVRINRFQHALKHLRQLKQDTFCDVAYRCGYADQSHFIREFNEFTGASPTSFLLRAHERIANFPEWKLE